MKQVLKATVKTVEEFSNHLEAIGAGICSVFEECVEGLAREINKVLAPLFRNEEKQAKRWAEAFDKLDKQHQDVLTAYAKTIAEGMRQYQTAWAERYNLKNFNDNMKKLRSQ